MKSLSEKPEQLFCLGYPQIDPQAAHLKDSP